MPTALNTMVQEPPATPAKMLGKNTGFPEPFNAERNTTLAHPDADTSPNATIEGPEISLSRTHSRKISFLSHRSKHSNSSGKIDPAMFTNMDAGLYDVQHPELSTEKTGTNAPEMDNIKKTVVIDAPQQMENDGEVKPVDYRDEQGYLNGERKKGVLRKRSLHKS